MNVKYIGLDISTSIVGISLLDCNGDLVNLHNINLKKTKCIFDKSNKLKEEVDVLYQAYSFEKDLCIFIEEPFQSFSKGFSSAKTLSQLNKFNGIVSYIFSVIFNSKPLYINVNSARKNLQIKIDKSLKDSTKEQVFSWVKNQISFDWPEKILKSGPNKGLVKFDESCYDMSDAFVICKAGYIIERQNITTT